MEGRYLTSSKVADILVMSESWVRTHTPKEFVANAEKAKYGLDNVHSREQD